MKMIVIYLKNETSNDRFNVHLPRENKYQIDHVYRR